MTQLLRDESRQLHVVGALHIDEVATVSGNFVPAASNPVSWRRFAGGVAANAARAAHDVLGMSNAACLTYLHAAIGEDIQGQALVTRMEERGLLMQAHRVMAEHTGRYSVVVDNTGEMIVGLSDMSLAERLEAEQVMPVLDGVENGILLLDANLSSACIGSLIHSARSNSMTVAALSVSPAKALRILPFANSVDLLFCNRREAESMLAHAVVSPTVEHVSTQKTEQLSQALARIGFNNHVLTDAANPVHLCVEQNRQTIEIPPVRITKNVNGAGDTLAGASIGATMLGKPLAEAITDHGIPMAIEVLSGKRLPLAL